MWNLQSYEPNNATSSDTHQADWEKELSKHHERVLQDHGDLEFSEMIDVRKRTSINAAERAIAEVEAQTAGEDLEYGSPHNMAVEPWQATVWGSPLSGSASEPPEITVESLLRPRVPYWLKYLIIASFSFAMCLLRAILIIASS